MARPSTAASELSVSTIWVGAVDRWINQCLLHGLRERIDGEKGGLGGAFPKVKRDKEKTKVQARPRLTLCDTLLLTY